MNAHQRRTHRRGLVRALLRWMRPVVASWAQKDWSGPESARSMNRIDVSKAYLASAPTSSAARPRRRMFNAAFTSRS